MEIHQLLKQGFSKSNIAKKLQISRTTLYRYLNKAPKEMAEWLDAMQFRTKKLDKHKTLILSWLRKYPDVSAAQIYDWLHERYGDVQVGESTVRSYVKELRSEYDIPKETRSRSYEAIPDPPMGQQAQVDFGMTTQKNIEGKSIKLYFIAFVLSHSRYKYMEWLDRPFTTRDVIQAHENAFYYFEGIPFELVYDQDNLIVVSENAGDLILTSEFETYRRDRDFKLRVCRRADPESKGRIENVVGFIKYNFAKHRIFTHLNSWNEQGQKWLQRTGNNKTHHTIKKRPIEVFTLEKQHLRPTSQMINTGNIDQKPTSTSITRTVRKDNTVLYKSNRYSVPLGTYSPYGKVVCLSIEGEILKICDSETGEIIGKHNICQGKGQLVQDRNHTRDRSRGISAYIETLSKHFQKPEIAKEYLEKVRKNHPRYIRDQLQLMSKQIHQTKETVLEQALSECISRKLYSANEFTDIVAHLHRQQVTTSIDDDCTIETLHVQALSVVSTIPEKRDINEYLVILEGGHHE